MSTHATTAVTVRAANHQQADQHARSEWPRYNEGVGITWDYRPGSFAAERNGEVVGVALFHTVGGVGHLGQIVVRFDDQRQGIGSMLYHAFERECLERGCHKLTLETAQWQAREFYVKLGFSVSYEKHDDKFHGTWFAMEKRFDRRAGVTQRR